MKKQKIKWFSILLALIMVTTTMPQMNTSIPVNAQELNEISIELETGENDIEEVLSSVEEVMSAEVIESEEELITEMTTEEVSIEVESTESTVEDTETQSEASDTEAESESEESDEIAETCEENTADEDVVLETEPLESVTESIDSAMETEESGTGVVKEVLDILPSVVVKESYDTYLSLTLSVPTDAVLPVGGELYYVVAVTTHKSDADDAITQEYFFVKEETSSQDVTIQMNNGLIGEGQEWTYDIVVSLIHTMAEEAKNLAQIKSAMVGSSSVTTMDNVEVTPYYETKLTLKKKTTTVYTTQQNVAIATVKFSKKTTEKDRIKVEDITYGTDETKQYALTFEEVGDDLIVYASANEETALGKHTIKVTAAAPEYMYASEALITVNVVQGIEEGMLSMVTPSDELYKADKKAASLTFKVQYLKDSTTLKNPNKKKVTWEVLDADGTSFSQENPLYGMITVKNGVVSVKNKYVLSENPEENQFIVKATAADFKGNTVSVCSEVVEIVAQSEELGEVAIVKPDDAGNWIVTARSETTITSDLLGYVRVFRVDAPVQDSYTDAEMEQWTFEPQYMTFKSSNSAVKIDQNGCITSTKPAKNVKITVTANDKSKKKVELKKLTIAYAQPEELALKVELIAQDGTGKQINEIHSEDMEFLVSSQADSLYRITVMQKSGVDTTWEEVHSHVNYSLSVKNGKVINKSGEYKQYYLINSTKEKFTIKLTDKAKKESVTYTITNTTFPKGKAPKLSTKDKLKALSYAGEQTITYTLKKNGKFVYDYTGKTVLITVDSTEKNKSAANEARYNAFEQLADGIGYQTVDGGTCSLFFVTDSDAPLPAGSYKLWFTFGTLDSEGNFLADTAATAIVLKAQKVTTAKGTYTPTTSYKVSVKEGGTVELTGKGKRFLADTVSFSNLRNANVSGSPNAFRDYFELTENTLKLKDDLTEEQLDYITGKKAKNDLICYVDYKVSLSGTDGSYSDKTGTVKLKVTMQDSIRKFTTSTAKAKKPEDVVSVTAYANKKSINILHACTTAGRYETSCDGTSKLVLTPKTGSNTPTWGTNTVTIYVVPEGTYEANKVKLDALKAAWDEADSASAESAKAAYVTAMKKYGIKTTAKVVLPDRSIENRELAEQVVTLVNKERAKIGLGPLKINDDVMYAAYLRAKETSVSFSHTRPDGRSCFTILGECDISYNGAGENIAYGYPTAEAVMNGWMNSSGHRANILYSSFTEIGVGCYESNGRLYWVQLFIY